MIAIDFYGWLTIAAYAIVIWGALTAIAVWALHRVHTSQPETPVAPRPRLRSVRNDDRDVS